jgi:acetyl esterase/lipase
MSFRIRARLRHLVLLVSAAAVLAGVRGALRRRQWMAAVVADLRTPLLYVPLSIRGPLALRLIRSAPMPDFPIAGGCSADSRTIPTEEGHELRVIVYERSDRERPSGALLWIHGGGLIFGRPEQGHALCSRWADELGLLVVSVDYRHAPEHPFPAALDDCYTALRWMHDEAEALGVDPDRVAVGGDSAGGHLAAAVSQMARDRGGPAIRFQLLEYPMLDDRTVLRADHENLVFFLWSQASNRFGWTSYLGHAPGEHEDRPYAVPARMEDLEGLPPAWVGVGELDLFHDEDVEYARRLQAAGVPCELDVVPGMYHGADAGVPGSPTSKAFRDRMTTALAAALAD